MSNIVKAPIVADLGSGTIKAEFGGELVPRVTFPTMVGNAEFLGLRDVYVGEKAQAMREVLAITHPIEQGIVTNWDRMESIWEYTFNELNAAAEDHVVVFTESASNSNSNREKMKELLFEAFKVPALNFGLSAAFALGSSGLTTALVIDSGHGVTDVLPIFEGSILPGGMSGDSISGETITDHLYKIMKDSGHVLADMRTSVRSTDAEKHIAKTIKEKLCYVAPNFRQTMDSAVVRSTFPLPDGRELTLGNELFRCTETLFQPSLLGFDGYGIHITAFDAILKQDIHMRFPLLSNILLVGGNALMPGIAERLESEISALASLQDNVNVLVHQDPINATWKGASQIAVQQKFQRLSITKQLYNENGPSVLHGPNHFVRE